MVDLSKTYSNGLYIAYYNKITWDLHRGLNVVDHYRIESEIKRCDIYDRTTHNNLKSIVESMQKDGLKYSEFDYTLIWCKNKMREIEEMKISLKSNIPKSNQNEPKKDNMTIKFSIKEKEKVNDNNQEKYNKNYNLIENRNTNSSI